MILVNAHFCPQNHPCPSVHACPEGAISQQSIYEAPRIDHEKCTECGVCTSTCRVFSLAREEVGVS